MGDRNTYAPIGVAVVFLVILQIILVAVDCKTTSVRVAEEFARNYFYLSPDMEEQLCAELTGETSPMTDYLYRKQLEANQRGFSAHFVRRMFTKMHVGIIDQSADTAKIHISGITRTAINPAMMVIGKWFFIGQNYPVDMTVDVVKENGRWRVCGNAFAANMT